jgi:3-hydroxybutyryl-CoA dehydrogenase
MTKVLVIGAGVMGHGIAQAFAQKNYAVALQDNDATALERAHQLIAASLTTLSQENFIELSASEALANITFSQSLKESAHDVDIAIEAIHEDVGAKKELFSRLDQLCPPHTILASNTSYLNVFDFVETHRPDKVLITHWFAPPQLIPLVEVVKGEATSEESINTMMKLLKDIGKRPIYLKKFIAGFALNRLQHAFNREVHYLIDNGYISPGELDEATRSGLAVRMTVLGVVARMDFAGLSMRTRHPVGFEEVPPDYEYKTLKNLIEKGFLGVKAGRGFYDYGGRPPEEVYRERDLRLIEMLRAMEKIEARGPLGGNTSVNAAENHKPAKS